MKNAIAILGMLLPVIAQAGGPIDGVYNCSVVGKQAFMVITGHPDGDSIYTWPAVDWAVDVYGYGVGTVSGNSFSGFTSSGGYFNFRVSGSTISGELPGSFPFGAKSFTCTKIW